MKLLTKNQKNYFIVIVLATVLFFSTFAGVYAASYSSSFSGTWYTGNGGSVNGTHNKAYHTLGKGTASISSSKYYIIASAGTHDTKHTISGILRSK